MRFVVVFSVLVTACSSAVVKKPPVAAAPARQNPSPMADTTRAHERVVRGTLAGRHFTIDDVLAKPVDILITPAAAAAGTADLVVHFHGAEWLPMQSAEATGLPLVVASVQLGAGSSRYANPFADETLFPRLLERIRPAVPNIRRTWLTAFSAGYGAVRAILRQTPEAIDGVLLLDGLHASYIPDARPLAEGGAVDVASLEPFVHYARRAVRGGARLVVTHSEIFPGTFASTTETADHLLESLGLRREAVLRWGPLGMQQLSEAGTGGFRLLGFAGNTAPDHIDHFHAWQQFFELLYGPPHAGPLSTRSRPS